ncbi:hypothetical protein ACWGH2_15180 [Streptomyces sp. NPDC054871]
MVPRHVHGDPTSRVWQIQKALSQQGRHLNTALARLRASAGDGAFDLELFENKANYRR